MKLRDIALGGILAAGAFSCAHEEARSPQFIEYLREHPRHYGIGSVISSGPYEGYYGVGTDYGDHMMLTFTRTPQTSRGKSFASFDVAFDMKSPDGLVLKREGDFEYHQEAMSKLNPFFK